MIAREKRAERLKWRLSEAFKQLLDPLAGLSAELAGRIRQMTEASPLAAAALRIAIHDLYVVSPESYRFDAANEFIPRKSRVDSPAACLRFSTDDARCQNARPVTAVQIESAKPQRQKVMSIRMA